MVAVKVGCCGFGMSQRSYFESFSCVEVQQTFYQPPLLRTLEKWRSAAPAQFEFTLKAWQFITHTSQSPTYRRLTGQFSDNELKQAGAFGSTSIVAAAFETTLACATALKSKSILFQCPASFDETERHMDNMRRFFTSCKRPSGVDFYWEPRGDWSSNTVLSLCKELNLHHAVDPFLAESTTSKHLYYRLHGVGGWKYVFTDDDNRWLASLLRNNLSPNSTSYVFFNNVKMTADAKRFEMFV
jgi:uncharacterized protein YecE (DUF72 family)